VSDSTFNFVKDKKEDMYIRYFNYQVHVRRNQWNEFFATLVCVRDMNMNTKS